MAISETKGLGWRAIYTVKEG